MAIETTERMDPYDFKNRRRDIERRLTGQGLLGKNGSARHDEQASPVRRLRRALQESGPIFALFGRYLSSRADLIPIAHCLELDAIPDQRPAISPERIRRIFQEEIGELPDRIFLTFDDTPHSSRLIFQIHRARLVDGTPINIHLLHPVLTDEMEGDLRLLPLLQDAFTAAGWSGLSVDEAVADFRRVLPRTLEDPVSPENLETLIEDERLFHRLAVPHVYRECSSRSIHTYERLSGWTLEELIQEIPHPSAPHPPSPRNPYDLLDLRPDDIARLICLVWLRQAMYGRTYPIDTHPGDILVLNTHQIAFTGGLFATLPTLTKENVRHYLTAAAAPDPDRAYGYLTQEMEEADRAQGEHTVRNRFRQVVPFRDGPLSQTSAGDTLAEHLLVHWRIVREHGYHVRIHMRDFYRGLFAVTRHVQQLAPDRDLLKEGLEDLRSAVGLSEIRDMMDENVWRDAMSRYTVNLLQLPHVLNEILSKTSDEDPRPVAGPSRAARSPAVSSVVVGLLCFLAAIAFVSRHLVRSFGDEPWIEGASAGLFLVIGLLTLRAIYRK